MHCIVVIVGPMSRRVLGGIAGVIALGIAWVWFRHSHIGGLHGVVLTYGSRAPIVGADVTVACQQATLHGYRTLRTLTARTGPDGSYRLAAHALGGCGHLEASAAREGYLDPWDMRLDSAIIERPMDRDPEDLWLVDEDDVVRLNLEGLLRVSQSEYVPSHGIPDNHYSAVVDPFMKSKKIARTPQDLAWIRANYCSRLEEHWARTPEQSQTKLMQAGDVGDHEAEVVRFCANEPAPIVSGSAD